MPNKYTSGWSPEDVRQLNDDYNAGLPKDQMSKRLGRSISSITNKLNELNIKGRKKVWTNEGLKKRKQRSREQWLGISRKGQGKGKRLSEEHRKKISSSMMANIELQQKRSQWMRKYNLLKKDYSQPWNVGKHPWDWMGISEDDFYKMLANAGTFRKNRIEGWLEYVINEYQLPFQYVGDGKIWIGGKCPDFISSEGKKQLIEVASEYWHPLEEIQSRIDHFRQFGYSCFVLWVHEISKLNETEMADKIRALS